MNEVLVALLIVTITSTLVCISALAWLRWRMRVYLRVRPSVRTLAPTGWALSGSEPARLHRRLRRVAASARIAGANGDGTTSSVAQQIEDEAMRLEACLVALSRIWRAERQARRELTAEIAELERLTARFATSTSAAGRTAIGAGSVDTMAQLRERLDVLEAARTELTTVEQQAGLRYG